MISHEQLSDGISYGLLRYLSDDGRIRDSMAKLAKPQLRFNYLGQFGQNTSVEEVPFRIAPESTGSVQDLEAIRTYLVDVIGIVTGGRLQFRWMYSRNLHLRSTFEALALHYLKEIRALAEMPPSNDSTPIVEYSLDNRRTSRICEGR